MSLSEQDIAAGSANDRIGTDLVMDIPATGTNPSMRVWHLRMAPGECLPPHRHDRPYFWSALTSGRGRSRLSDGRVINISNRVGDSKYFPDLTRENMFVHDLENIGVEDLVFVTIEFDYAC